MSISLSEILDSGYSGACDILARLASGLFLLVIIDAGGGTLD